MSNNLIGNPNTMKTINKTLILELIIKNSPISRTELTKQTNLSPTTISTLVNELIKEKFIIESGYGESKGGRKPVLLDLNSEFYYTINIIINSNTINAFILNLRNNIIDLEQKTLKFPVNKNIVEQIKGIVKSLLTKSKYNKETSILGMSLAWPGIIGNDGIIKYTAKFDIEDFDLLGKIEGCFDFPIYIENDANLACIGEKKLGKAKKFKSFIYIMIGEQIGSGVYINDEIYKGAQNMSGEFGHTIVNHEGPICDCGSKGCLTAVKNEIISSLSGNQKKIFSNNNKKAYKKLINYISVGVANYIRLFDPEAVIFGGNLIKATSSNFLEDIKENIEKYTFNNNIQILTSDLEEKAICTGGASVCFRNFYSIELD